MALHPGTVATPLTARYLGRHPSVPPETAASEPARRHRRLDPGRHRRLLRLGREPDPLVTRFRRLTRDGRRVTGWRLRRRKRGGDGRERSVRATCEGEAAGRPPPASGRSRTGRRRRSDLRAADADDAGVVATRLRRRQAPVGPARRPHHAAPRRPRPPPRLRADLALARGPARRARGGSDRVPHQRRSARGLRRDPSRNAGAGDRRQARAADRLGEHRRPARPQPVRGRRDRAPGDDRGARLSGLLSASSS